MLALCYLVEVARTWRGYDAHCKEIDGALAVMGRYGRQSMVDLETKIPLRKLWAWVREVGDLIQRENDAAKSRR